MSSTHQEQESVANSTDRAGSSHSRDARHAGWVRICHWIIAAGILTLAFTGIIIFMAHPRLYWGEVGNDLTPALFEIPVSRNYRHGGWEGVTPFFEGMESPVSASRTYEIFNQNGWGRSLHFLAAWFLVVTGLIYVMSGLFTGHVKRHLIPGASEFSGRLLWRDLVTHLRMQIRPAEGGPPYGLLQKIAYFGVIFLALPLIVITGLAMSPAINASLPFLSSAFGGVQSARTIHFFLFVAMVAFFIVHVLMVVLSGFRRQLRAMTFWR